jgi:hypothetical protein
VTSPTGPAPPTRLAGSNPASRAGVIACPRGVIPTIESGREPPRPRHLATPRRRARLVLVDGGARGLGDEHPQRQDRAWGDVRHGGRGTQGALQPRARPPLRAIEGRATGRKRRPLTLAELARFMDALPAEWGCSSWCSPTPDCDSPRRSDSGGATCTWATIRDSPWTIRSTRASASGSRPRTPTGRSRCRRGWPARWLRGASGRRIQAKRTRCSQAMPGPRSTTRTSTSGCGSQRASSQGSTARRSARSTLSGRRSGR